MSAKTNAAGYFAIKMSDDGLRPEGWWIGHEKSEMEAWKERVASPSATPGNPQLAPDPLPIDRKLHTLIAKSDLDHQLIVLMLRYRDAMASVRGLVLFNAISAPLMNMGTLLGRTMPFAKKNLTIEEENKDFKIYSYDFAKYLDLVRELRVFRQIESGMRALPSAALLSMIATFDSYFAETVKLFLSQHPEKFDNSAKPITIKDLIGLKGIDDIYAFVIDGEISALMRGSHREQVEYVEKNLGVDIISHYERWRSFVEIFERRNLAAHGNMVVNSTYLRGCATESSSNESQPTIGDILQVDVGYLLASIDILTEFGMLLIFSLWVKHNPASIDAAFLQLNEICVDLIKDNRSGLAINLLSFAIGIKKSTCTDRTYKMMTVNLANAYKKNGEAAACEKLIKKTDWSASSASFQLCVASLRGDVAQVVDLMPKSVGDVSALSFRDWPVLDWVRDDPKVVEAFAQVYGEALKQDAASEIIVDPAVEQPSTIG